LDRHNNNGFTGADVTQTVTGIFNELCDYTTNTLAKQLWLAADHNIAAHQAQPPNLHLYDGIAGLASFFAAYYSVTKDPEAQRLALLLTASVRKEIEMISRGKSQGNGTTSIGGMVGLGSLLYSFIRLADWLKAPELFDSALATVAAITPELILADQRLNVVEGCAGALLALLAFAQEARTRGLDTKKASDLAQLCGQHLLARRIDSISGQRAWLTTHSIAVSGFAFGVSGISYALVRLFQHTGREEFREAALEGFAFERALCMPEQKRRNDPSWNGVLVGEGWCCGVAGFVLSRVGSVEFIDVPAIHHDIEGALSDLRSTQGSSSDQLCCGTFGKIDTLYTAATILERISLSEYALHLTKQVLARSITVGFRFEQPAKCHMATGQFQFTPSLFMGLSGIGYVLLRLLYPGLFPSMLLLESPSH
jgi:lantibiotic modifying enzyme